MDSNMQSMEDTTPLLRTYQYEGIEDCSKSQVTNETTTNNGVWTRQNAILALVSTLSLSVCLFIAGQSETTKVSVDKDFAAFAIRNPGDPMLPGDEMLNQKCDGSSTTSLADSDYRMVYDEGTIRLYAKARLTTAIQKANWNILWTSAKFSGGWGEPYWDMFVYETSQKRNMPSAIIAENSAILFYTERIPTIDNKMRIKFVSPDDESVSYYEIAVSADVACDKIKLVLGCDGNLVVVPYKSTNPSKSCKSEYQSNPYARLAGVSPTAKPTSQPSTPRPTFRPTKQPITMKPTKQPVTKRPTKQPVTKRPTKSPIVQSSASIESTVESNTQEQQQAVQIREQVDVREQQEVQDQGDIDEEEEDEDQEQKEDE